MTSDERRDIAARLRALPIDTYAVRKEWEEGGLFIDANLGDEADYSQIHNAVFGCFPAEYMHAGDYEELHERLADLIDPTCTIDVMDTGERADYECRERIMHCSHCNAEFGYVLYGEDGDVSMDDKPKFCPGCGARVTDGGDA